MNTAARNSRAPSATIRASSSVLAALATGVPLFLLILGLSIQTYQQLRETRTEVEMIPLPPPPPEPQPAKPEPVKPSERQAAPAPAAPRPASLIDQSKTILPNPPPAPPSADISGTGTAMTPGSGSGGTGLGGSGTGPGNGGPPPAHKPVRTGASWVVKPGTPELRPFNPPRARNELITGQAILNCRVLRTGNVADCRVVYEAPRLYGFGKAALSASVLFVLNPPTIDGEPDEQRRVEIPVTFNNHR